MKTMFVAVLLAVSAAIPYAGFAGHAADAHGAVTVPPFGSGAHPHDGNADRARGFQTTFGYWNDNLLYPEGFGGVDRTGRDDFVTASFWFQVARGWRSRSWLFLDAYYSIVTNRRRAGRTDMLAVRFSFERPLPWGRVQLGSGVVANGDYGGDGIQNAYHGMTGVKKLNLSYAGKTTVGGIFLTRFSFPIRHAGPFMLDGCLANDFRTAAGPSRYGLDLSLRVPSLYTGRSIILGLETLTGCFRYYHRRGSLSTLFNRGVMWGAMMSCGLKDRGVQASGWITGNRYGGEQLHYGVTVTFGWNGTRTVGLGDMSFP